MPEEFFCVITKEGAMGKQSDKITTEYNDYVEGMEESMSGTNQYAAKIHSTANDQKITALHDKLAAQRKQTDTSPKRIML